MSDKPPIEGKVSAATIGSGAGVTLSAFVLWLLGVTFWNIPNTADKAADAIAAVPSPVNGILVLAITVGITFAAGYKAKHSPRPMPTTDGALIIEQAEVIPDGPMQNDELP